MPPSSDHLRRVRQRRGQRPVNRRSDRLRQPRILRRQTLRPSPLAVGKPSRDVNLIRHIDNLPGISEQIRVSRPWWTRVTITLVRPSRTKHDDRTNIRKQKPTHQISAQTLADGRCLHRTVRAIQNFVDVIQPDHRTAQAHTSIQQLRQTPKVTQVKPPIPQELLHSRRGAPGLTRRRRPHQQQKPTRRRHPRQSRTDLDILIPRNVRRQLNGQARIRPSRQRNRSMNAQAPPRRHLAHQRQRLRRPRRPQQHIRPSTPSLLPNPHAARQHRHPRRNQRTQHHRREDPRPRHQRRKHPGRPTHIDLSQPRRPRYQDQQGRAQRHQRRPNPPTPAITLRHLGTTPPQTHKVKPSVS